MPARHVRRPVLLALALLGAPMAQAKAGGVIWQQWLNSLRAAGYGVTQGSVAVDTPEYCQRVIIPVLGMCNGNDPSDPYVLPLVPFGAGYIDPYFGTVGEKTLSNGTVVGQIYELAPTEAELIILNMPPLAAYFSYQNNLYSRPSSQYPNGAHHPSLDPARGEIRGTYNNSTNNIDILRQSGIGFGGGTIAIITTPNSALADNMRQNFASIGGNPAFIFTSEMGADVNPGLGSGADDFNSVMRYMGPQDTTASRNWLLQVQGNVQVYRIDQPAGLKVTRFATPAIDSKLAYAQDESVHSATLAELSQIMQGWLATQESYPVYHTASFGVSEMVSAAGVVTGEYGPSCIANGTDCVGDEQDTAAYWNATAGKAGPHQAFVVDGVNHAVTGNATIISLAVIDGATNTGALGVSQTNPVAAGFAAGGLSGSAAAALHDLGLWGMASPALRQDAGNLYVQIFSRGCLAGQTYCTEPFTKIISERAIPDDDAIVVTARAYVLPGSTTGANPDFLLAPQLIN